MPEKLPASTLDVLPDEQSPTQESLEQTGLAPEQLSNPADQLAQAVSAEVEDDINIFEVAIGAGPDDQGNKWGMRALTAMNVLFPLVAAHEGDPRNAAVFVGVALLGIAAQALAAWGQKDTILNKRQIVADMQARQEG